MSFYRQHASSLLRSWVSRPKQLYGCRLHISSYNLLSACPGCVDQGCIPHIRFDFVATIASRPTTICYSDDLCTQEMESAKVSGGGDIISRT